MNCKPGDLAVIVNSCAGNLGKIVRCIRLAPVTFILRDGGLYDGPSWEIDTPLAGFMGDVSNYIADNKLRPIRDTPGDESFVTEARKSLTITKQNDKLKKVPA